jgi:cyclase
VITTEGVILIDTPLLPDDSRRWHGEIRRHTERQITYVINTDHHRGHVLGNQFFPTAKVIAHEFAWKSMHGYGYGFRMRLLNLYRERMPEAAEEWEKHLEIVEPEITFTSRVVLVKGEKEIHLLPLGGHTRATTAVYLPAQGVLFTGDLVVTDRPPFLSQSNTKRWLNALTRLRKLDYDVLIPGHGEPTGKEATERMSEFLRLVRRRVRSAHRAGLSKYDTARTLQHLIDFWPIPPFEQPKSKRRFKSSLSRVWNEMRAEAAAKARDS